MPIPVCHFKHSCELLLHLSEHVGHHKNEQRHQLNEVVLQRSARQENAVVRLGLHQRLVALGGHVLQHVRLVVDDVLKGHGAIERSIQLVAVDLVVGGEDDVHLVHLVLVLAVVPPQAKIFSFVLRARVVDDLQLRAPAFQLVAPVFKSGGWHHNGAGTLGQLLLL